MTLTDAVRRGTPRSSAGMEGGGAADGVAVALHLR